jgi:hypothetical protein
MHLFCIHIRVPFGLPLYLQSRPLFLWRMMKAQESTAKTLRYIAGMLKKKTDALETGESGETERP